MRVFFFRGILVVIIAALSICLYEMIMIRNTYVHEEQVHNVVLKYAPSGAQNTTSAAAADPSGNNKAPAADINSDISYVNNTILDAQRDINEDIAAWLRVPNTYIDYPVVHYEDNNFYINHDVMKKKAASGALFIDSRNNGGFSDFNTIIYGHNMKNGSMFGKLNNFSNSAFFSDNPYGQLFLADDTYTLEIFAYLRVQQDDKFIYGSISGVDFDNFDEYVKSNAINYRNIRLKSSDRIVTLSTCTNVYEDARMVVLARLGSARPEA